eukprot:6186590-Pleurochrysis_carterae.AAC.4
MRTRETVGTYVLGSARTSWTHAHKRTHTHAPKVLLLPCHFPGFAHACLPLPRVSARAASDELGDSKTNRYPRVFV